MPVGLRGKRQSQLYFSHGQWRRARPGQSERTAPREEERYQAGLFATPRAPRRRRAERRGGSRDGSPSSDFRQRRRRAPNCRVERAQSEEMGQRDGKSETPRRGPVKRKEPSELKRRGGQKETERERGDPQGRNGSSAKRLKEHSLRRATEISEKPEKEGGRRRLPAPLLPEFETPSQPSTPAARMGEGAHLPPTTSPHMGEHG